MKFGVHLPQFGRIASPEAIQSAAVQAEELDFEDVWASDHLAVAHKGRHVPSHFYEPLVTLTWAAAVTSRIGIGTSVLVLPYRHPLHVAKQLASLDLMSRGRLTVGVGAGWMKAEFAALGVPFAERGVRTDEAIEALRACWEQDPVYYESERLRLAGLRVLPQPGRRIPIWVGGFSEAALRRAVRVGDGWQGTFMKPTDAKPIVEQLRSQRLEQSFVLSMRVAWDGLPDRLDSLCRQLEEFRTLGFQHILVSPGQPKLDSWLRSVEILSQLVSDFR